MVQNFLGDIVRQPFRVVLNNLLGNVALRHPDGLVAVLKLDKVLLEAGTLPLLVNSISTV